jgi:hypothetical protein
MSRAISQGLHLEVANMLDLGAPNQAVVSYGKAEIAPSWIALPHNVRRGEQTAWFAGLEDITAVDMAVVCNDTKMLWLLLADIDRHGS